LHNPAALVGVKACRAAMPKTPMAFVFDTSFHFTMPDYAYMYAIDYADYEKYKIRRYGFHGTSHKFVSQEAAKYLGKNPEELKIITCHLGNGSSITAVDGGKSVDTSMGFTPLAGVPMGTRSGDIDPAAAEYLAKKNGWDISEALTYLNKKCGVAGVSGVSSDCRDICDEAAKGNYRAQLALKILAHNIKKIIGSYVAEMNGVDALVFTAGIGENDRQIREDVCKDMSWLGVEIDETVNKTCPRGEIVDISAAGAKTKTFVIPTNEEYMIALDTQNLTK
jgi:acetate kinase